MIESISATLGERVDEMYYLDSLATAPEYQGRGYGGVLVDAVNHMVRGGFDRIDRISAHHMDHWQAEQHGRAIWLVSTLDNATFYGLHGYSIASRFTIGEANPTWHKPPVVITLVSIDG